MLKHIKTFEEYDIQLSNDQVINEEFLDMFKSIKSVINKIDTINDNTSDDEVKNIFFELFDKLSKQTNFSVTNWKNIKENFINKNKISKETMIDLLNQLKSDYEKTGKSGYLAITQNNIIYKKSDFVKTKSGLSNSSIGSNA